MNAKRRSIIDLAAVGALLLAACTASGNAAATPAAPAVLGATCGTDVTSCNVVWSYSGNSIQAGRTGATISGGGQRGEPNQVTGDFGVVGGGEGNVAGEGSIVAGGVQNTAINFHATVGGGASNLAVAEEATVAGGFKNTASQRFSTVGGGAVNTASDMNTTVAGGSGNTASFTYATVGGGTQNTASSTASVVAGGDHNLALGAYSSVLGGLNNTAEGYLATVGGGAGNEAAGSYATIAGGFANAAAGSYSFAAGRMALVNAEDPGTFLFADSSPLTFPSIGPNEFAVRATGGVRLVTAIDAAGAPTSGVRLTAGSGSWETLSDVNSKSGFDAVDEQQILDRLMQIPIETWHYRSQAPSIRHIGPTAQDFSAAFSLGEDPHYISTVDADGVALASIQQLYRIVKSGPPLADQSRIDLLQRQLRPGGMLAVASLLIAVAALRKRTTGVASGSWDTRTNRPRAASVRNRAR